MVEELAPRVTLTHGAAMPRLGLGTWPMDNSEAEVAVRQSIELGYRLFDTAENYRNEEGVGRGIKASGIPRGEVFVTTKFNKAWHGVDLVREAFEGSAKRMGVDYIDLLLIHWPNPEQDRYVEAWQGLIRLREEGVVRAIGTSNFKPAHMERIVKETGLSPEVNQIQLNPTVTRESSRAFAEAHGTVTQAWSPVGQGKDLLGQPVITNIAERLGKTPAQIVLRWHMELGLSAVPKTSTPSRMTENINVFDFSLTPADLAAISTLDRGEGAGADSDRFGH